MDGQRPSKPESQCPDVDLLCSGLCERASLPLSKRPGVLLSPMIRGLSIAIVVLTGCGVARSQTFATNLSDQYRPKIHTREIAVGGPYAHSIRDDVPEKDVRDYLESMLNWAASPRERRRPWECQSDKSVARDFMQKFPGDYTERTGACYFVSPKVLALDATSSLVDDVVIEPVFGWRHTAQDDGSAKVFDETLEMAKSSRLFNCTGPMCQVLLTDPLEDLAEAFNPKSWEKWNILLCRVSSAEGDFGVPWGCGRIGYISKGEKYIRVLGGYYLAGREYERRARRQLQTRIVSRFSPSIVVIGQNLPEPSALLKTATEAFGHFRYSDLSKVRAQIFPGNQAVVNVYEADPDRKELLRETILLRTLIGQQDGVPYIGLYVSSTRYGRNLGSFEEVGSEWQWNLLLLDGVNKPLSRVCRDGRWTAERILECGDVDAKTVSAWRDLLGFSEYFRDHLAFASNNQSTDDAEWSAFQPIFNRMSESSATLKRTLGDQDVEARALLTSIEEMVGMLKDLWEADKRPGPSEYKSSLEVDTSLLEGLAAQWSGLRPEMRNLAGTISSGNLMSLQKADPLGVGATHWNYFGTQTRRRKKGQATSKSNSSEDQSQAGLQEKKRTQAIETLRDVVDDLEVKVDQARLVPKNTPRRWNALVNVIINTRRYKEIVNGYEVYYVAKGWANVEDRWMRFRQVSSPIKESIAPGRYMFRVKGGEAVPIKIGGDGNARQDVDLLVK
jgi:hypothetical protein